MAAIFTAAQVSGISVVTPGGVIGGIPNPNDSVSLQLSDSSSVTIFDSVTTGLKILEFMRQRAQVTLQASDDIIIVSTGAKLFLCEMTLTVQRLLASFTLTYQGGKTLCVHRTLSQALSLEEAFQAVGFAKLSTVPWSSNVQLTTQTPKPHIIVFDWNYRASPTEGSPGSLLNNPTPLGYDYTA